MFDHFTVARAAVFPSYAEAFALAPLESMVRGVPTIYSTRGSGSELMDDGKNGLLVDPDNPDHIADAIIKLLSDHTFADEIGRAGRQRIIDEFTVEAMSRKNAEFFRDCIEKFNSDFKLQSRGRAGQTVNS